MKILIAIAIVICLATVRCGYHDRYDRHSEFRRAQDDFRRAGWEAREEMQRARRDWQREMRQAREDWRREMRDAHRDFRDEFGAGKPWQARWRRRFRLRSDSRSTDALS